MNPEVPGAVWSRRRLLGGVGLGAIAAVAGAGAAGAASTYGDDESARTNNLAAYYDQGPATSMQVLWRANTTERVIALSFDDGPSEEFTPHLLDVLHQAGVRASFGIVGERAALHPDILKRQVGDGHELFNHSWSHPDLSLLNIRGVASQLDRCNNLLESLTGRRPAFVRPPYGRLSGAVLEHVAESHQSVLMWHMRFAEERFDSAGLAANIVDGLVPGSIVLSHDRGPKKREIGMAAIPSIIRGAHEAGYRFVTASEMLYLNQSK